MRKNFLIISFILISIFLVSCGQKKYEVKYDLNYGTQEIESDFVGENEVLNEPKEPTREGYRFLGWFLNGEKYEFIDPVTKDLILVAEWEELVKTYKITLSEGVLANVTNLNSVAKDTNVKLSVTVPNNFTISSFKINGVERVEDLVNNTLEIIVKEDLEVVVTFEEITISVFTITFTRRDGSVIDTVEVERGEKLAIPPIPELDGYEFLGWYLGNTNYDFESLVTRSFTLVASFGKKALSVDEVLKRANYGEISTVEGLVLNGGYSTTKALQNIYIQDLNSGQLAILTGINVLGSTIQIGDLIRFDAVLTKVEEGAEVGKVYLAYDSGISVVSSGNSLFDYKEDVIEITSHEEMLAAFSEEKLKYGQVLFIKGTYYYNSNWTNYQVGGNQNARIHLNGLANTKEDITYGGKIVVLNDNGNRVLLGEDWFSEILGMSPDNYPGTGYPGVKKEGGFYAILKNSTDAFYYLSVLTPDDFIELKYNVTFDYSFEEEHKVEVLEVVNNNTVDEPTTPVRDGYEFLGWYLDGVLFDFETPIRNDIVLVPRWKTIGDISEENKVFVHFELDKEGLSIESLELEKGDFVFIPDKPIYQGFVFVGWYIDDVEFDFSQAILDDIVLTAKWEVLYSLTDMIKENNYDESYYVEALVLSGGYSNSGVLERIYLQDSLTGETMLLDGLLGLGTLYNVGDLIVFKATLKLETSGNLINKHYLEYESGFEVISSDNELLDYYNKAIVIETHEELVSAFSEENIKYGQVYAITGTYYYNSNWSSYQTTGNHHARLHMNSTANSKNGLEVGNGRILVLNDNANKANLGTNWFEDILGITKDNYPGVKYPGFSKTGIIYVSPHKTDASFTYLQVFKQEDFIFGNIVEFDYNYDLIKTSEMVIEGNKLSKPLDPIRDGYEFLGWFLNDNEYDFEKVVEGHLTLVAKWEVVGQVKEYVVNFMVDEELYHEEFVNQDDVVSRPINPVKEGFILVGWYIDDVEFDFSQAILDDIVLTAKWEVLNSLTDMIKENNYNESYYVEALVLSGGYSNSGVLERIYLQDSLTGETMLLDGLLGLGTLYNVGDLIVFKATLKLETSGNLINKHYLEYESGFEVISSDNELLNYRNNAIEITNNEEFVKAFGNVDIKYGQVYAITGTFYYSSNWLSFQTTGNHHARITMNGAAKVTDDIRVEGKKIVVLNDNANKANLGTNWFEDLLGITVDNYPGTKLPGFSKTGVIYVSPHKTDNSYTYLQVFSVEDFIFGE